MSTYMPFYEDLGRSGNTLQYTARDIVDTINRQNVFIATAYMYLITISRRHSRLFVMVRDLCFKY